MIETENHQIKKSPNKRFDKNKSLNSNKKVNKSYRKK